MGAGSHFIRLGWKIELTVQFFGFSVICFCRIQLVFE